MYLVDETVTDQLMRSLWTRLLSALPSPCHLLLPTHSTHFSTLQETLDFLQVYKWKLAAAQKAAQKMVEDTNAKGKSVERADSKTAGSRIIQLGAEYGSDRKGMPCGHVFKKGEAIYRCRCVCFSRSFAIDADIFVPFLCAASDCGHDDTCVQCAPCFNASNHEGHDIVFSVSVNAGGCCDCGDDEAWHGALGCKYHDSGSHSDASNAMDTDAISSTAAFSSKGKGRADEDERETPTAARPGPPASNDLEDLLKQVPETVKAALDAHVSGLLDFVLDTFEHAPEAVTIPSSSDAPMLIKNAPSLDPRDQGRVQREEQQMIEELKRQDYISDDIDDDEMDDEEDEEDGANGFQLLPPGAYSSGSRELSSAAENRSRSATLRPSRAPYGGSQSTTPRPGGEWSTVGDPTANRFYTLLLWNDEKHDFSQVIDIVMDVTGRDGQRAKAVAERVDKHGRDIIDISADIPKLLLWGLKLNSIDLAVSIRPAFDIFAEEIAALMIKHLLDLSQSVLYLEKNGQMQPTAAMMRALVTQQLLSPWHHLKPISAKSMSPLFFSTSDLRKLDGILLLESKLRKELRGDIKEVIMACIGIKETKKEVGECFRLDGCACKDNRLTDWMAAFRFAHMYSKILETFILRDREADHSICTMTVQLFSVPSIASALVSQMGFMEKLLLILQSIFTSHAGADPITLPPPPPLKGQANPNSPLFKQQRCYHIFYDVRYLLTSDGVQQQVASHVEHLNYFLDFLALFNAITPDRRAVHTHVEYESEVWIPVFHVSSHLGRLAKLCGEAFAKANVQQLGAALGLTSRRILLNCLTLHSNDPDVHAPVTFHSMRFAGKSYQIVDFAVDQQAVSFHHPMHWLFAEMLRHVGTLSETNLASLGKANLPELLKNDVDENGIMVLLEFPLRVAVKLAQVRCGMWVRNGLALRSQAHHYRENPMRDIMYDQDLYLLQCGLLLADPGRWLVSMVDRFGLTVFIEEGPTEQEHDILMADELMLLLINLVTETSSLAGWSKEKQIRREIVHYLALGSGTYSDITKPISERFTDHSSFERELANVSKFKAPDGITDLGIFELRDECFDEVNPYFVHYSRNQREKAEEILLQRHKKKGGTDANSTVWTALKSDLPQGPLASGGQLFDIFLTAPFIRVLATVLTICQNAERHIPDSLLDSALHLLSAALIERGYAFVQKMLAELPKSMLDDRLPLLGQLCILEADENHKGSQNKISWLINRVIVLTREANDAEGMDLVNNIFREAGKAPLVPNEVSAEKAKLDARRAAAKARQAAIMQKFSAQQKDLLKSLEEDGGGEEDLEEEQDSKGPGVGSCILCQEDLDGSKSFGMLAHTQPSRTIRMLPCAESDAIVQTITTPLTLDRGSGHDNERQRADAAQFSGGTTRPPGSFPPAYTKPGVHTTTCGHLMHASCFWDYCRSVEQRHALQIAREHPEDLNRYEYVCPLCKALGNMLLPLAPSGKVESDATPLADWIRKINIDILKWSSNAPYDYQEVDAGTGTFLPWYAEDCMASLSISRHTRRDPETYQMLDRFATVLRMQSAELKSLRTKMQQRTILSLPGRKLYIPQELVGYTVSMIEIGHRGLVAVDKSVAHSATFIAHLSESTLSLVKSLLHCLRTTATLELNGPSGLTVIRQGLLKRLLPHWAGDAAVRSPLILRDPLSILVEAAIVAPEALDHIITLMYYVTLVQLVFGLAQPSIWPVGGRWASPSPKERAMARHIFPDVRWTTANIIGLVGYARGNITLGVDHVDDDMLAKLLCTHSLPFLRRAAILRAAVFGVENGRAPVSPGDGEYIRLMNHLRIPLPSVALPVRAERQTPLAGLIEGWIKHAYVPLASLFRPLPIHYSSLNTGFSSPHLTNPPAHPTLLLEHPHIYELVELPSDLAVLLQETQQRPCKRCGDVPADPALCLLCGEILCYQSFCCQSEDGKRGECNRHTDDCGGSIGIYFKVKTNAVLLLFEQNGTFLYSPYLDSHGEVDIGLRKGRPQRLHRQRYDELRKQWLQHGISNLVARKIEASMEVGGWGTF